MKPWLSAPATGRPGTTWRMASSKRAHSSGSLKPYRFKKPSCSRHARSEFMRASVSFQWPISPGCLEKAGCAKAGSIVNRQSGGLGLGACQAGASHHHLGQGRGRNPLRHRRNSVGSQHAAEVIRIQLRFDGLRPEQRNHLGIVRKGHFGGALAAFVFLGILRLAMRIAQNVEGAC